MIKTRKIRSYDIHVRQVLPSFFIRMLFIRNLHVEYENLRSRQESTKFIFHKFYIFYIKYLMRKRFSIQALKKVRVN